MSPLLGSWITLFTIAAATASEAAPSTPQEAERLTSLFERYLGHRSGEPSAVRVTPDGDSYRVSLDVGRLLAPLAALSFTATTGALKAELTPQSNGQWRVVVDGLPGLGFAKDREAFSLTIDGYKLDGVFDPALQAFSSASTRSAGSTTHSVNATGTSDFHVTQKSTGTYGATDGGAGTINVQATGSTTDFAYGLEASATAPGAEGSGTTVKLDGHGSSFTSSLSVGNERNAALNDFWAFLVAHGSKTELVAHQPELKAGLRAMLPFASAVVGDLALSKLTVTSSMGAFGIAEASEHYEFNGPGSKDGVRSRLKMSGLSLPDGLIPAWAGPLTPTGLNLTQSYGPINLTPVLLAAIDDFDLSADKPLSDEQVAALKSGLVAGDLTIHVAPSTVSTALMTVKFESDLRLSKPLPTGTATVSVTGLDRTIDAVRAVGSDDPSAAQAIGFLSAVKILAKAEGLDSYSWRIEAKPGSEVTINGNPLGAPGAKAPRGTDPSTP